MEIAVSAGLSALENLKKIKQREVACPIIKARAITSGLMTIDDLVLKTTIASPDLYDIELTKLIHRHSSFPESPNAISLNDFTTNISYIDRKVLIWGIFASTYNTLGEMNIKCPYCGLEFKDEVKADQLIQPDSMVVWDKDVPFNEYILKLEYICNIEGLYKIEFDASLPSISQHLNVMKLISPEKLKENFSKFGNIFSKAEDVASILRAIRIYKTAEDTNPEVYITPRDIHRIVCTYFTMDISDYVLEKTGEEFDKFAPVFKKPYTCSDCKNDFDYVADPEASLFRQFFRRG